MEEDSLEYEGEYHLCVGRELQPRGCGEVIGSPGRRQPSFLVLPFLAGDLWS